MNNILAIDSSGKQLTLGISFGGDRMVNSQKEVEQSHGQIILKSIRELLQSASLHQSDLNSIVVNVGPGSFTGLRIGLATAKGMAVALGLDIVAVNIFELAAYKLSSTNKPVTVITPLKKDEFFACEINNGQFKENSIEVLSVKQLNDPKHQNIAGININPADLVTVPFNDFSGTVQYTASDLIALGKTKIEKNDLADLSTLEPMYIQKSQAEINYDKRNQ